MVINNLFLQVEDLDCVGIPSTQLGIRKKLLKLHQIELYYKGETGDDHETFSGEDEDESESSGSEDEY